MSWVLLFGVCLQCALGFSEQVQEQKVSLPKQSLSQQKEEEVSTLPLPSSEEEELIGFEDEFEEDFEIID
jgi:hypothetical protein